MLGGIDEMLLQGFCMDERSSTGNALMRRVLGRGKMLLQSVVVAEHALARLALQQQRWSLARRWVVAGIGMFGR